MRTEDNRLAGLDIYRILCCIGVLIYHVADDTLGYDTSPYAPSRIIYYFAGYCVPGFFLLSGFLLSKKEEITLEYSERKIVKIVGQMFGWAILFTCLHFARTGELYNCLDQLENGLAGIGGILVVGWFIFTYCVLLIIVRPISLLWKKSPLLMTFISTFLIIILSIGGGGTFVPRGQSLWLDLYGMIFLTGYGIGWWFNKRSINKKIGLFCSSFFLIVSSAIYFIHFTRISTELMPHQYYGKWFYMIWLISGFGTCLFCNIHGFAVKITSIMAKNTMTVYLAHLPILLMISAKHPIITFGHVISVVLILFIGCQLIAEIFRRLPLLRKIV